MLNTIIKRSSKPRKNYFFSLSVLLFGLILMPFSTSKEQFAVVNFGAIIFFVSSFLGFLYLFRCSNSFVLIFNFFLALISTAFCIFSGDFIPSIGRAVFLVASSLSMFYFYHKLRGKSELIEYSVVLSGFILSIYYVANFFYAASNHGFGNVLFDRVTGGLASLPWGASNVVAGCIVITYVVLTNIRSVKFSNVMFLSFVFFLGIAVTFSKTGIVLFFVLFLSFIVSKKKVGLSSLLSVIVFIVSFLVVMFYAFSSHLDALSDLVTQRSDFEDLASGNGRFNIWYQALMHFASSPLQPVGYYGSIYHFGHSSHNYYITLLLEQGVIPFFLHVIFFLVLFLKSIALSRLHVVGFIVILINLVFEDVNFVHPYMFYFSFYILILAMKKNDRYIRYYS